MKRHLIFVLALLITCAFTVVVSAAPADKADTDPATETFIQELQQEVDGASDRAVEKSKGDQQSFVCVCSVSCWPEPHIWCSFNWCVGGGGCCSECYWANCLDNCG
ncbi:MAG: hypothetical protein AAF604_00625 [Acidobacteriota bacterium]